MIFTGVIDAIKIFRLGYSINAWLWLTAIVIIIFFQESFKKGIEHFSLTVNPVFTIYFMMFWMFFGVILDFFMVLYVFRVLDKKEEQLKMTDRIDE